MQPTNQDKLKGAAFAAGVFAVALAVYFLIGQFSNKFPDDKPIVGKADYIVGFLDESSRSIPQNIALDSPQFDALKASDPEQYCHAGLVSITEDLMQKNNYGPLLGETGGAPGLAFMDKKTGSLVKATRLPTDAAALDALLKKYCTALPPPLPEELPKTEANFLAAVKSRGGDMKKYVDPQGVPVVEDGGVYRRLAALAPDPRMLAALPQYGASNPIFPVNEWRPVSHRNLFGKSFISNQGQISSCVANGWVGTIRRSRVLYGMKDVPLSQGFFYSLINGGKDQGAVISDGIAAYCKTGTCTFELIGQSPFFKKTIGSKYDEAVAEAKRFKGCDCFRIKSWEEACSAIQAGYVITFGVMVDRNWTHFDKYGVCGHDSGPGNHCVAADGMVKVNGKWVLDAYNSWGEDWGPFKNGRMYLDKDHLFGNGDQADVCCIRLCGRDPQDPYAPPAYKHKAGDAQFGIAH